MVNVQNIRGRGASRTRAGSNVSATSSVGAAISDPRARLSSLASGYCSGDDDGPNLHKKRSKGTAKLALKLKKSLRDLIFKNAKIYTDYYQKSQGLQTEYKFEENRQGTETYNDSLIDRYHTDQSNGMDHEYYSHDEEDPPLVLAEDNENKQQNKFNKYRNAPSIQMRTNVFKKSKKDKHRHPVVDCEGIWLLIFLNIELYIHFCDIALFVVFNCLYMFTTYKQYI